MSKGNLGVGDLIIVTAKGHEGLSGIVSQPITEESEGHVLVLEGGHLHGIAAALDEVDLADEGSQGFIQIAYNLIKLGSHVIEKAIS